LRIVIRFWPAKAGVRWVVREAGPSTPQSLSFPEVSSLHEHGNVMLAFQTLCPWLCQDHRSAAIDPSGTMGAKVVPSLLILGALVAFWSLQEVKLLSNHPR
jgi:hypothetical protein